MTGFGSGFGSGFGTGDGTGYGFGDGDGFGFGDSFGDGDNFGYGFGDGSGSGFGSGDGDSFGDSYGYGYGYGCGYGDDSTFFKLTGERVGDFSVEYCEVWGLIKIGCEIHTLEYWRENWRDIADKNNIEITEPEVIQIIDAWEPWK